MNEKQQFDARQHEAQGRNMGGCADTNAPLRGGYVPARQMPGPIPIRHRIDRALEDAAAAVALVNVYEPLSLEPSTPETSQRRSTVLALLKPSAARAIGSAILSAAQDAKDKD